MVYKKLGNSSSSQSTTAHRTKRTKRKKEIPTQQRDESQGFTKPESTPPAPRPDYTDNLEQFRNSSAADSEELDSWVNSMRPQKNEDFDASNVDKDVESLRKQLMSGNTPDTPEQVDLSDYQTQLATIKDISNKYGFDYSREYAEQQAQIQAQAEKDEIANSRERQEQEVDDAKEDLGQDFFKKYLEQQQNLTNKGLNAGIASERNTRLEMGKQDALSEILSNQQLANQEMDRRLQTIDKEEAAYTDELYNKRLQQGFDNSMTTSEFMQGENQFQAQMEMEQRKQKAEEQWREYEFNNMSASERESLLQNERQFGKEQSWREYEFKNMSYADQKQLAADAERFGKEQAWQRHKFDAGLAFESGALGK